MQAFSVTKLVVIASHLCWSLLERYRPDYDYHFSLLGAINNTVTFLIVTGHLCMFSHQILSVTKLVVIASHLICWSLLESYRPDYDYLSFLIVGS